MKMRSSKPPVRRNVSRGSSRQAPTSSLARTGAYYNDGTYQYVAADNEFTHTAADGPANKAFTAAYHA